MALTYIKEKHRVHGTTSEIVVCPACFETKIPDFMKQSHGRNASGYSLEVREWRGSSTQECSYCPTRHDGTQGSGLAKDFISAGVVLLCLLLSSPAFAQSPTKLIIAANVADLVSTEIAVQRANVAESNPIMGQSSAQRIAVKAAGTALQVWMVRKLEPRHPKIAKGVGVGAAVLFGGVTIHNLRVGR
jgi:hypothetical protein